MHFYKKHAKFEKNDVSGYSYPSRKIKFKTLVYGNKMPLGGIRLDKGARLPGYKHLNEQTGYLASGGESN